jgi:hypothetical protein
MGKYARAYAMIYDAEAAALAPGRQSAGPLAHVAADTINRAVLCLGAGAGITAASVGFGLVASESAPLVFVGWTGSLLALLSVSEALGEMVVEFVVDFREAMARRAAIIEEPQPVEQQVIRPIPVNGNFRPDPVLRLSDGHELGAARMRDFIVTGFATNDIGSPAWRGRGWTPREWETARDLLSMHGLATPREKGKIGKFLATQGRCLQKFGL